MPPPRFVQRFFRPLAYITSASLAGAGALYLTYRPRNIPGSEPAAVPPPIYGSNGHFQLPKFPDLPSRQSVIESLRASSAANAKKEQGFAWWASLTGFWENDNKSEGNRVIDVERDEPYDLLIIGCGATGAGIALDAATRGLRVAVVERDDFSAGTSSKSTKLVHGGVRYLEKAVWELDYNQ
jgi:glycerol-3-phosphate dehydrogenase